MKVALTHTSHYQYQRPVFLGPQIIRLRPAPHTRTSISSYSLQIRPAPSFFHWQQDPQGNYQARIVFPQKIQEFHITVDFIAEMVVINPFDFLLNEEATYYPFAYDSLLHQELTPFLKKQPAGPQFSQILREVDRKKQSTIDYLIGLNQQLKERITYQSRIEPGVQSCEETLEKGVGSCRDTAWLLIQMLRHCGLAARFVSGYLIQLQKDPLPLSEKSKDSADLHAWAEVYLPGAGWVGLDPTSGLFASEGHIPVAATSEPQSAAPLTGTIEPCESTLSFSMSIQRMKETASIAEPYSSAQWEQIFALGEAVDIQLEENDVRLTMGGEPTFNSAIDRESPEWKMEALGPQKRLLAFQLLQRLREKWAPTGMLHLGQGKFYPGELVPRWALTCYWRRDDQPLWRNAHWIAQEDKEGSCTWEKAQHFLLELARELGPEVHEEHLRLAYEDAGYFLWQERKLPVNISPFDSRLQNAEERAQLARLLERGLDHPIGALLPLEWKEIPTGQATMGQWRSGPWFTRFSQFLLLPGDRPMGYRLPLDSLPWMNPQDYPSTAFQDPLEKRGPLPSFHHPTKLASPLPCTPSVPPQEGMPEKDGVRTAICAEVREGRLYLFLPPLRRADEYLELVAAIERVAEKQEQPLLLEGYPPAPDSRLQSFQITPDPGVIEVNLHPVHNWQELVRHTKELYEEARQLELGTEKFMLDGRHVGTGGGNHFLLGGATPADSPILRRPDLLRSLLTYWQNHPSLSYLFSGLFIGPTSQSPRIDEARHESLDELEIAFSQLPSPGEPCLPWLVDRLFRHLLVDVSGNTHRAEFCMDKLYPEEAPSRRLGLLELRAFEMPPHEQMSLTQQLFLRALVAHFWKKPYQKTLIRWGATLHDSFMLPHFIAQDLKEVIRELNHAGLSFEWEWFLPHFEFRFPLYGSVTYEGVTLELRSALEPWPVLAEEGGPDGVSRQVDSSLERLQVRVIGMIPGRHYVTCNGRRLPLQPTGTSQEFIAGVRYRAWKLPHGLHPNLPVHTPLTFDLWDSWNQRSQGGCVYHVKHPAGSLYETLPIHAGEAESRRGSRFLCIGHTPGSYQPPPTERDSSFLYTLDLRTPSSIAK